MMIEPQSATRNKGDVGQHVVGGHGENAILQILGMHKFYGIDFADVLQQNRTDQAIEIRSGNKAQHNLLSGSYSTIGSRELLLYWIRRQARQIRAITDAAIGYFTPRRWRLGG